MRRSTLMFGYLAAACFAACASSGDRTDDGIPMNSSAAAADGANATTGGSVSPTMTATGGNTATGGTGGTTGGTASLDGGATPGADSGSGACPSSMPAEDSACDKAELACAYGEEECECDADEMIWGC